MRASDCYLYCDFDNEGIGLQSSVRKHSWTLDNMYRRDLEYGEGYDPEEYEY